MSSGSNLLVAVATLVVVIALMTALQFHVGEQRAVVHAIHVPADSVVGEAQPAATGEGMLRVCADPNNLPFSNQRGEGFENHLATLIAEDLNLEVSYSWWPQRRGFLRNTLSARNCDLVMGVPAQLGMLQTTRPYYRSTYVFVTRARDQLQLRSLEDARLSRLRIGLHTIGDDYSNVPPAQALAARGITDNVRGYSIYGNYAQENPPRALIDALTKDEIDVAIAWGPLAGYFAQRAPVPLTLTHFSSNDPQIPTTFSISMGVRRGDNALQSQIENVIARRQKQIDVLLTRYGVPLVAPEKHVVSHLVSPPE